MMKKYTLIIFLVLGIKSFPQSVAPKSESLLVLQNATIIDGTGAEPLENQTLVLENGKISAIFEAGSEAIPTDAFSMDLSARYIIPGLIDSHVHLATDPSGLDNRPAIEHILKKALYRGITSVRDMAGDNRALFSMARDAKVGDIAAPNIYYAAVMSGPSFFADPRAQATARGEVAGEVPWARAVTEKTDLRQAVAEAKGAGATAIKIYSDLPPELVRQITKEAHRQSMQVWAHTTVYPTSSREVIEAGADVVSHLAHLWPSAYGKIPENYAEGMKNWLDGLPLERFNANKPPFPGLFREMKDQGTVFDPTVWVFWDHEDDTDEEQAIACSYVQAAQEMGIPHSTGTDQLLAIPLHDAIEVKVTECGLTPLQAIRSATLYGAMAIGNEEMHGSVETGKIANLVVLGSDPTENIENLRDVLLVFKNGRMYDPGRE